MDQLWLEEENSFYFLSTLVLHLVFENFKEPTPFVFIKEIKNKIGDITIYQECVDNNIVDFNGDTLTFTVISVKIWTFFFFIMTRYDRLEK